eukprot:CAMPEP_0184414522 /NCGR_PEP_ID=MMETSP0738-20130409/8088_1 /TAXON_ID=385413 /ORGANISM="Thalassiosira miniscula, Strain CCMP1093" /LENGTH=69 /DNA_ID=CAMNT_0026773561 /DNA_START=438 /DNA_END=647 /DNA_ORIENTATION=-
MNDLPASIRSEHDLEVALVGLLANFSHVEHERGIVAELLGIFRYFCVDDFSALDDGLALATVKPMPPGI